MNSLKPLLKGNKPIIAPMALTPMQAALAEQTGFKALYLGGGSLGYEKYFTEANLNLTEMAQIAELKKRGISVRLRIVEELIETMIESTKAGMPIDEEVIRKLKDHMRFLLSRGSTEQHLAVKAFERLGLEIPQSDITKLLRDLIKMAATCGHVCRSNAQCIRQFERLLRYENWGYFVQVSAGGGEVKHRVPALILGRQRGCCNQNFRKFT